MSAESGHNIHAKMAYKFDTHVHTAETSICGKLKAAEIVRLYRDAGYSGICITDHYYENYFSDYQYNSWEQAMDRYLEGYHKALECGKKLDITVLPGAEIRFTNSPNDYLLYGLTERFLYSYPKLYEYTIVTFRKLAKEHNILIFQAHPFRPGLTREDPQYLDGVEVLNGNPRHDSHNDLAANFAEVNHLYISAGSDCHRLEDVGRSGIMTNDRIQNMDILRRHLSEPDIDIIEAQEGSDKGEN